MITPRAKAKIDQAGIDMILVGDSLGNVILGHQNTLGVRVEHMIHHASAVVMRVQKTAWLLWICLWRASSISPEKLSMMPST
ncbi:MAG: 3-methyl-2-oxobutanoate hydroxymethyltransferase [Bdellovibrionota bacterium]